MPKPKARSRTDVQLFDIYSDSDCADKNKAVHQVLRSEVYDLEPDTKKAVADLIAHLERLDTPKPKKPNVVKYKKTRTAHLIEDDNFDEGILTHSQREEIKRQYSQTFDEYANSINEATNFYSSGSKVQV